MKKHFQKLISVFMAFLLIFLSGPFPFLDVVPAFAAPPLSSDATLFSLSLGHGSWNQTLEVSGSPIYSVPVSYETSQLTVIATSNHPNATIKITNNTNSAVNSGNSTVALTNTNISLSYNYITVEVTAQDGITKATYSITVDRQIRQNDAYLASLTIDHGTLSPAYSYDTTNYSASVNYETTQITLAATTVDSSAAIKITNNGQEQSGYTSASMTQNLNVGDNIFTVEVTASDQVTKKVYTITINRNQYPSDANLSALTIDSGTLSPAFSSGTTNYTASVDYETTQLTVAATGNDPNAAIKITNNAAVQTGTSNISMTQNLNVGDNVFAVEVTAQDGTKKNYTITVNRAQSLPNTKLSSLTINQGTLSPVFNTNTTDYSASVNNETANITISATSSDAGAFVNISNGGSDTGAYSNVSRNDTLIAGNNVFTITVVAADGITRKNYTLTINRNQYPSNDTNILPINNSYTVSSGIIYSWYSAITKDTTIGSFLSNFNTENQGASCKVIAYNATVTDRASYDAAVAMNTSATFAQGGKLAVLAADGITVKVYQIYATINGTDPLKIGTLWLKVTDTSSNPIPGATVAINGGASVQTNGSGLCSFSDITNINDITYTITASGFSDASGTIPAEGITNHIDNANGYQIMMYELASTNATLRSLVLNGATLNTVFTPSTVNYTATVPYVTEEITVSAESSDRYATLEFDHDANITTQYAGKRVRLNEGENVISLQVTAQDSSTSKTYTITVTREGPPSGDATLASLVSSVGTISPELSPDTTYYSLTLPYETTSFKLTPRVNEGHATVSIGGTTVTSGTQSGDLSVELNKPYLTIRVTAQNGTQQDYRLFLNILPQGYSDADLAALEVSDGQSLVGLNPNFSKDTISYNTSVAGTVSSIHITPTPNCISASIKINGNAVQNGADSGAIALNPGNNTINIVVTAWDGVTTKTYTLIAHRNAASTDNTVQTTASNYLVNSNLNTIAADQTEITTTNITAEFLGNLTKDQSADWKVASGSIADSTSFDVVTGRELEDKLQIGDKLFVKAENGSVRVYQITVTVSHDATVASIGSHYSVNNDLNTIAANGTSITSNVTIGTFLDNLKKNSLAAWKVVPSDTSISNTSDFNQVTGKAVGDSIAAGDMLAVVAADGTTIKVYNLTVTAPIPDPDYIVINNGSSFDVLRGDGIEQIATGVSWDSAMSSIASDFKYKPYSVIKFGTSSPLSVSSTSAGGNALIPATYIGNVQFTPTQSNTFGISVPDNVAVTLQGLQVTNAASGSYRYSPIYVSQYGTLYVENGTNITTNYNDNANGVESALIWTLGTVRVEGGLLMGDKGNMDGIYSSGGRIYVSDGTVQSQYSGSSDGAGIKSDSNVYVSGTGIVQGSHYGVYSSGNAQAEIKVTGGIVSATDSGGTGIYTQGAKVTVSGGEVRSYSTSRGSWGIVTNGGTPSVTISGGSVISNGTTNSDAAIKLSSDANVTINGTALVRGYHNAILADNGSASINVDGGNVEGDDNSAVSNSDAGSGVRLNANFTGTFIWDGGTIVTSNKNTIYVEQSPTTMDNAMIKLIGSGGSYVVYRHNKADLRISAPDDGNGNYITLSDQNLNSVRVTALNFSGGESFLGWYNQQGRSRGLIIDTQDPNTGIQLSAYNNSIFYLKTGIKISSDASLAGITLTHARLVQPFAADTLTYQVLGDKGYFSYTMSLTFTDPNSTVSVSEYSNQLVKDAQGNYTVNLGLGMKNAVTIVVTAQDGITQKTYTLGDAFQMDSGDAVLLNASTNTNYGRVSFNLDRVSSFVGEPVDVMSDFDGQLRVTLPESTSSTRISPTFANSITSYTVESFDGSNYSNAQVKNAGSYFVASLSSGFASYRLTVTIGGRDYKYIVNVSNEISDWSDRYNSAYITDATNSANVVEVPASGQTTSLQFIGGVANSKESEDSDRLPLTNWQLMNLSTSNTNGLNIDSHGLLTVSDTAAPGLYAVLATYQGIQCYNFFVITERGTVGMWAMLNPSYAAGKATIQLSNGVNATLSPTPPIGLFYKTGIIPGTQFDAAISSNGYETRTGSILLDKSKYFNIGLQKIYVPSSDDLLVSLGVNSQTLGDTATYGSGYSSEDDPYSLDQQGATQQASVPYSTASIRVAPVPDDYTSTMVVNYTDGNGETVDQPVEGGNQTDEIPLKVGQNTISITVTAEDHSSRTYTLTVTRDPQPQEADVYDTVNYVLSYNYDDLSYTIANEANSIKGIADIDQNCVLENYYYFLSDDKRSVTFSGYYYLYQFSTGDHVLRLKLANGNTEYLTIHVTDSSSNPTTHSVSYDLRGGSGDVPTQGDVAEGETFTIASGTGLTKEGYTFGGWTSNQDNESNVDYTPGTTVAMSTEAMTLYAVWLQDTPTSPTTHTVTYKLNNGTGTLPTQGNVAEGTEFTAASGTGLARAGYTFAGWNTAADGGGTSYAAGVQVPMSTGNIELYAQWTQNEIPNHTVTYKLNNGTGTLPTQGNVAEGTEFMAASGTGLARAGYTFAGWNTAADGSGSSYAAGVQVPMSTGNIELYAQWTYITVTPVTPPPTNQKQPEVTPVAEEKPVVVQAKVIDNRTGESVKAVEATIQTEKDGTKTVAVKSQDAIVVKQNDGTKNTLSDTTKLDFTAPEIMVPEGSNLKQAENIKVSVNLSEDGTIKVTGLANNTETKFNVTYDLGGGFKIVIGKMDVKVDDAGNVSVINTLIDPYGTIIDKATGKAMDGVKVILYYANTERNIKNGKAVDTQVNLPEIQGFKPNNNINPQISTSSGEYGWMVYPTSDYYIIATKDGYITYKSPIISVEQELVKFDFSMNKTNLTKPSITLVGSAECSIKLNDIYKELGATAVDSNGVDLTKQITTSGAVDVTKVGDYEITYKAKDLSNNEASVTRTVHVINTAKPVITLNGDDDLTITVGDTYKDAGATAVDYANNDITDKLVIDNGVNSAKVGDYTVIYNVTDHNGNKADQVARTVHVINTAKPAISLNGEDDLAITVGDTYKDAGATAVDYANNDITDKLVIDNEVNSAKVGDYVVIYNVTDHNGNKADQVTRTVHVIAKAIIKPVVKPVVKPAINQVVYKTVIIAGATDSISGSVLAARTSGKVLSPKDYRKIKNLKSVKKVYILGGKRIISAAVEKQIKGYGIKTIIRLGGVNAYETSVIIAKYLKIQKGTPVLVISSKTNVAFVTKVIKNNTNYYPIVLTTLSTLDKYAKVSLMNLKPKKVYIVADAKTMSSKLTVQIVKLLNIKAGYIVIIKSKVDIGKLK